MSAELVATCKAGFANLDRRLKAVEGQLAETKDAAQGSFTLLDGLWGLVESQKLVQHGPLNEPEELPPAPKLTDGERLVMEAIGGDPAIKDILFQLTQDEANALCGAIAGRFDKEYPQLDLVYGDKEPA